MMWGKGTWRWEVGGWRLEVGRSRRDVERAEMSAPLNSSPETVYSMVDRSFPTSFPHTNTTN